MRDGAGNALWWGLSDDGASLGYRVYHRGTLGPYTAVVNPTDPLPYWLRIRHEPGGVVLAYSTRGPAIADTTAEHAIGTPITAPVWAGFSLLADGASLAAPLTAAFDDAQIWTPAGTRPFAWYVYRNPKLGGISDIEGATMQLAKQGPAHAYVSAITKLSVLCDDQTTGCDAGPMGAI